MIKGNIGKHGPGATHNKHVIMMGTVACAAFVLVLTLMAGHWIIEVIVDPLGHHREGSGFCRGTGKIIGIQHGIDSLLTRAKGLKGHIDAFGAQGVMDNLLKLEKFAANQIVALGELNDMVKILSECIPMPGPLTPDQARQAIEDLYKAYPLGSDAAGVNREEFDQFGERHPELDQGADIYGEGEGETMSRIFHDVLGIGPDDIFLDAGSGTGKIPIQACLETRAQRCYGIELSAERHYVGVKALERLPLQGDAQASAARRVRLFHGSLTESDADRLYLPAATAVYSNMLTWPGKLQTEFVLRLLIPAAKEGREVRLATIGAIQIFYTLAMGSAIEGSHLTWGQYADCLADSRTTKIRTSWSNNEVLWIYTVAPCEALIAEEWSIPS